MPIKYEHVRIIDDLVTCENCDNPASKSLSKEVGWIGCAPCITGESKSFDSDDLVSANGGEWQSFVDDINKATAEIWMDE
jgi:hypothetical protein